MSARTGRPRGAVGGLGGTTPSPCRTLGGVTDGPPDTDPPRVLPTIELAGPGELATRWPEAGGAGEVLRSASPRRDRYVLLDPVGIGAMGTVHRAKDLDLRRVVAYKRVNDPERRGVHRRMLTEVQVTAQLDHPAVVPVYSLEVAPDGAPAYAMKLVEGRTLAELLDEIRSALAEGRPLARDQQLDGRLQIFLRVCDALAYAHSKGVIHRDLKPANVMLGPFGEVYLMDWGIARVLGAETGGSGDTLDLDVGDDGTGTRVGQVFGTPAYMSPEQARGDVGALDQRSDVYAMGLLLYEIVVLRRACRSRGVEALLEQARTGRLDPPDPPPGAPRPPRELLAIIRRATAVSPDARYPDIDALAADVRAWLRGEETRALPDTPARAVLRWLERRQRVVVGLLAATLVLAAVAVVTVWQVQQRRISEQALALQARQSRVTELLREVDERAQAIDRRFLWVDGQLEGLAAAAEYAFARGTPVHRAVYSAADYADPERAPPGLVPSRSYGKPIHPDLAVYTVAPGIPEAAWRADLALADGLREHLHRMLLAAAPGAPAQGGRDDASWIAERGNPLVWVYVAIDRSGLMYMAPGARGWDSLYDPRTRPWYRVALGLRDNVWGKPYVDLMGTGRLLSATRSMYLPDGRFLGVAGVDLQFEQVVEQLVAADDLPGIRTAYLVDGDGRVMVESAARDTPVVIPATEEIDDGIDFGLARRAEVRKAARRRTSGHIEVAEADGRRLVSWAAVPSVGWLYVVEADLQEWLDGEPDPGDDAR
ncbi:MAG: hypothetical protein D6798_19490 [Deltaproteobacteria bacterium]|nr:MAG: hypothetical protein D6798_19490 [Deltaproteobacteria bacterium]